MEWGGHSHTNRETVRPLDMAGCGWLSSSRACLNQIGVKSVSQVVHRTGPDTAGLGHGAHSGGLPSGFPFLWILYSP